MRNEFIKPYDCCVAKTFWCRHDELDYRNEPNTQTIIYGGEQ